MKIRISGRAKRELKRLDKWWRANRDEKDIFIDEFELMARVIREQPNLGRPYYGASEDEVRRVQMATTRYHIYYALKEDEVVILSIWGAVRGRGPKL